MSRWLFVAATALLVACPPPAQPPRAPDDHALRIAVANAEARRDVAALATLAKDPDAHARELAVRGLGRALAVSEIERALGDGDARVVAAALEALGVAASLEDIPAAEQKRLAQLIAQHRDVAATTALGRIGELEAELVRRLAEQPEAAALALGRFGRRKIALTAEARAALVEATRSPDVRVRYAAVYALSRESQPPRDDAAADALAARITDENAETRATAIAALARRDAITAGRAAIEGALLDRDWRVAVEAVRALAGEHGDDAGRDAIAAALARRTTELVRGNAAEAQVVTEGLRALAHHGERPLVATWLVTLTKPPGALPPLTRGWIACLATAALVRAEAEPEVAALSKCSADLPDHLRLPLLADLAGTHGQRAALEILLTHDDARVRAAAFGAFAAAWPTADDAERRTFVATLAAALGSPNQVVAGAAADAAPALYDALGSDPQSATLDAAVVARAARETEVELSASLYELIGKRAMSAGADACHAGLAAHPVRAHAAAECLRALGEAAEPAPVTPAPPPVDVAAVIGKTVRWHVTTTRGVIDMQLRPDLAPWATAAIAQLTAKHFYDGLEFHRVVPGFVVQGGDPTMSGWGGPGFALPSEPSDAAGFVAGGVGIADAGRDSGGSQWFVMHARAPHLDGRYTYIGAVVAGQNCADALLIGDRIVTATVEIL